MFFSGVVTVVSGNLIVEVLVPRNSQENEVLERALAAFKKISPAFEAIEMAFFDYEKYRLVVNLKAGHRDEHPTCSMSIAGDLRYGFPSVVTLYRWERA